MNKLRGTIVVKRMRDVPVRVSNDVEEFCEVVHIFTLTLSTKCVLSEMKYVHPLPIVGVT
jgi:hypothetical protein